jgi:iron complex transport system ATP-binding protein
VAAAGKTADTLTGDVLARVLGDNIRLDVTTGGVRVAVPARFDPAADQPQHASANPLTPHEKKRIV